MAEGTGSEYKLSATLEMRDQMSGKLRSVSSQLKSMNGAVAKLGRGGEVARLARQFDSLNDLRRQVSQFKELKKSVAETQQKYNQANSATAQLARQYKQGQSAVTQLQAKQAELKNTFETSKTATAQLQNKLGGLKVEAAKFKSSGATEEYKKLQEQIKATSAELKASQAMTKQTGAELKSLAGGVKQAQSELNNIGKAFEQSKSKAAQLKRELKSQQFGLNQMRQNLSAQGFDTRNFAASDRKLREQMKSVQVQQRQAQLRETLRASGMSLNSQSVRVNVSGNATSTLGKIKNQLNSLTQKTWNVAVNAKNAVGNKVGQFASGAAMGMGAQMLGTAGIGYGAIDAINTYKDFEYQMSTVKAITGANADEMQILTNRAKELGATTMFKASEVGKAEEYMAMAGWKTPQIDKGLPAVLNLAAASGEELARVSDIVTDSMTAFGLKATDVVTTADGKVVQATDHFADIMAALATNANTTVGLAGETSKYSAAVVGSLYASQSTDDKMNAVSDWAMLTGIMANAGIKGSMSGTAQRSMLTRLAALQQNANAARESLGVDFTYRDDEYNAQGELVHKAGQTRRLRDVVGDIRSRFQGDFDPAQVLDMTERLEGKEFTKQQRIKLGKMIEDVKAKGGMSDADKATITSMLAGQEGMAAWLSVLMASTEDWEKMADAIDKAHGKAEEMSKIKMDTLQGDVQTLGSAFEALQLEIFTGEGGNGLRSFVQGLTEDIRVVQNALKDGFDIGDIGTILSKVVSQLKNKFLEFDGVGSILAGGALVMGLKKIYDSTLKLKNAAMSMKDWYRGTTSTLTANNKGGAVSQSVGAMTIHANSVVVNGKAVSGGASATSANRTTTTTSTTSPATSALSKFSGALKAGGAAAAVTGVFAAMDVASTRNENEMAISAAREEQRKRQESFNSAQAAYNEAASDPERQAEVQELGKALQVATQELNESNAEFAKAQKYAVKSNNQALLTGIGSVAGGALGAAVGSLAGPAGTMIGGAIGASLGAQAGTFADQFDFDVLGWLKGDNAKSSVPQADWKTDSGKMFSQLSSAEKIQYRQNESATERTARETAESQVALAKREQFETENAAKYSEAGRRHRQDATQEEIESQTAKFKAEDAKRQEIERTGGTSLANDYSKNFQSDVNKIASDSQKSGREAFWKGINDFFSEIGQKTQAETRKQFETEQANKENVQSSVGGFFDNIIEGLKNDAKIKSDMIQSNATAPITATEVGTSGLNPVTGQITPPAVQMSNFNISDMLPDFNLSEWISTKFAEMPDITSMLPDFSGIGETIGAQLDVIPTKVSEVASSIGEGFNQIPTLATEAFNTVATYANEGLTTIQTTWNELPSFFSGIFSGLGGIASSAGSTIASGINSAIGTIKSAWEGLSSWLSSKISSLSSMASNAVGAVKGTIGIGHNATGTVSWRGGWTEVNEQGGEIIYLPSGTKIYPHATTMKMLQSEMKAGRFDDLIQPTDELGNIKGYSGLADNLIQAGDLSPIREAKLQKQREEMLQPTINPQSFQPAEFSTFPQAFSFDKMSGEVTNNSSSTTTKTNTGVTVTGNTFNVRAESDIDKIAFKLMELLTDSHANFAGA